MQERGFDLVLYVDIGKVSALQHSLQALYKQKDCREQVVQCGVKQRAIADNVHQQRDAVAAGQLRSGLLLQGPLWPASSSSLTPFQREGNKGGQALGVIIRISALQVRMEFIV